MRFVEMHDRTFRFLKLLAFSLIVSLLSPPTLADGAVMFRLYNPWTGEHFYTSDSNERDALYIYHGWNYEGIGWIAPDSSRTPVYRLYNPYVEGGDHHYTTSNGERDQLVRLGWRYEGIGWYSDDSKSVPLYRQYNPNAASGSHNYTVSKGENDALVGLGWRGEGIGWYGAKSQYDYSLFFVGDFGATYSDTPRAIYIRTDNPDPESISFWVDGAKIALSSPFDYDDVTYSEHLVYGNGLRKVDGGYLGLFVPPRSGTLTVQVREHLSSADMYGSHASGNACYILVASYSVSVRNSSEEQWMRSVIAACTTSSMTPVEKMDAVCEYLLRSQSDGGYGFIYTKVTNSSGSGGYIYSIRDQGIPYFVARRWNSYESPAALCKFARLIGGFDDIHNCYGDYPMGSSEWAYTHYYCRVTYQGEDYLFMACPVAQTGVVDMPLMVDFNNPGDLYPIR